MTEKDRIGILPIDLVNAPSTCGNSKHIEVDKAGRVVYYKRPCETWFASPKYEQLVNKDVTCRFCRDEITAKCERDACHEFDPEEILNFVKKCSNEKCGCVTAQGGFPASTKKLEVLFDDEGVRTWRVTISSLEGDRELLVIEANSPREFKIKMDKFNSAMIFCSTHSGN